MRKSRKTFANKIKALQYYEIRVSELTGATFHFSFKGKYQFYIFGPIY